MPVGAVARQARDFQAHDDPPPGPSPHRPPNAGSPHARWLKLRTSSEPATESGSRARFQESGNPPLPDGAAFHYATDLPGNFAFNCFQLTPPVPLQTSFGLVIWSCAMNLRSHGWNLITIDIQWYEPLAHTTEYRRGAILETHANGRLLPAPNRFPTTKESRSFKPIRSE